MDTQSRVLSLDILRGICISIVLIHHVSSDTIPNLPDAVGAFGFVTWKIRNLGWSGVDLFFVLSGFLISGLLFTELENSKSIKVGRFLLRRGLKIWPSYYVLIIILGLCTGKECVRGLALLEEKGTLLVHIFYLQNYLDRGVNGPTWSLAIEEHFYTVLPFLLMALFYFPLFKKKNLGWVPHLAISIIVFVLGVRIAHVFSGDELENDFMLTHFRIDALFVGVLLQYFYRNNMERMREFTAQYYIPLAIVSFILVSPAMFFSRNSEFMFSIGFSLLSAGYAIFIALVVCQGFGRLEKSIAGKCIANIGQWSYNIYLWHFFIAYLLPGVIFEDPMIAISNLDIASELIFIIQGTYYVFLSIALGALMTVIVEKPFLKIRSAYVPQGFKARVI